MKDIKQLIGNTLRIGVFTACFIALVGGIIYLWKHGADPMPDYSHFSYNDAHPEAYTTLDGIWAGILDMNAYSWIQAGVIALLLTPILRVTLSLFDFLRERDWLYAFITSVVLAIIISNSLSV
jgi:uncharacterized membrane protein